MGDDYQHSKMAPLSYLAFKGETNDMRVNASISESQYNVGGIKPQLESILVRTWCKNSRSNTLQELRFSTVTALV